MLSSSCFLCLSLRLPPCTVPCRIILASPDDRVTCPCPCHFSMCLFTEVRRSSYGQMAFPILAFTSSLVMWSLYEIIFFLSYSYVSRSLVDRFGTTVGFTNTFLHSSRFSPFRSMILDSRPVHSLMLSFYRFLCLPLRLPPWTVPCRIVLVSPDDRVTCPYHFSMRLFTEVRRSSYSRMAFPILAFTSSLFMWCRGLWTEEVPLVSGCCTLLGRVHGHHWGITGPHPCPKSLTCWLQVPHPGTAPQQAC